MVAEIEIFRKCTKMVRSTLRGRAKMWKVDQPDGDFQNLLSQLISDTFLNYPRPELLNPGSQD